MSSLNLTRKLNASARRARLARLEARDQRLGCRALRVLDRPGRRSRRRCQVPEAVGWRQRERLVVVLDGSSLTAHLDGLRRLARLEPQRPVLRDVVVRRGRGPVRGPVVDRHPARSPPGRGSRRKSRTPAPSSASPSATDSIASAPMVTVTASTADCTSPRVRLGVDRVAQGRDRHVLVGADGQPQLGVPATSVEQHRRRRHPSARAAARDVDEPHSSVGAAHPELVARGSGGATVERGRCQATVKTDPLVECAPVGGQGQAAVLTGRGVY